MENLSNYEKDVRPWGMFERFTHNEKTTVKILTVTAGQEDSLQTHAHRDEFWRVISGYGHVVIGDKELEASPGDEFFAPRSVPHRFKAGEEGLVILEIAFGDFDEHDEVRLEDDYGRV